MAALDAILPGKKISRVGNQIKGIATTISKMYFFIDENQDGGSNMPYCDYLKAFFVFLQYTA